MSRQQRTQMDPLDESLNLLSHPARRQLLTRLTRRDPRDTEWFDVEKLADEGGVDADRIGLVHNHLPKLADADYLTWDRERDVVTHGPRFQEIEPLVELLETHQDELPVNWP